MNVTLSINEELLKKARKIAKLQGKSLNRLIRDYLQTLSAQHDGVDIAAELCQLMDDGAGDLQKRSFNRDELHER